MDDPELMRNGYSIFDETLADLTYPEVEALARDGAVVLWGLGVIEEHGPYLPLGTDVYLPYVALKLVRRLLAARGIKAAILPPFYWGINNVTGSFAGSYPRSASRRRTHSCTSSRPRNDVADAL
jgi:creatinine amidohydrolase